MAGARPSSRICLGVIVGSKGLKGEVRIKSFTADPADIGAYGAVSDEGGTRSWTVRVKGEAKGAVVAALKGVGDRTAADALKGTRLYVDRAALPDPEDGTYYQADLVGLRVQLTTGEEIGNVTAVHNFGAGDILEVGQPGQESGQETTMVPFSNDIVAEMNVKDGFVRIVPIPGLLREPGDDEARARVRRRQHKRCRHRWNPP
ncbi:MAG: ribosome maturation factor RimM [Rhodospirillaceae bacterium]|nr:ribosome maturation factor RimM [Rhodospirillaceae bacterium]